MIALVIVAVIALALAIGLLLWPLLREKRAPRADADQAENLYQHDLGVSRIRRLYRADARRQAKELAAGAK